MVVVVGAAGAAGIGVCMAPARLGFLAEVAPDPAESGSDFVVRFEVMIDFTASCVTGQPYLHKNFRSYG